MLFDRTRPWTVLIVSHEADILRACDQVLVLRDGVVYAQGHYDDLLRDPIVVALVPNLSVGPSN
jgi:ABC-type transport system involved in cytochrome bd biosynthesis fused ATPase/permease subunit